MFENDGLMPLPGSDKEEERLAAALGAQMNLRAEPAPAASERLKLQLPFFAPAAC